MRRLTHLLEGATDAEGRLRAVLNQEQNFDINAKGDWKKMVAAAIAEGIAKITGTPKSSVSVSLLTTHLDSDSGKVTVGDDERTHEGRGQWATASGAFEARLGALTVDGEFHAETEAAGDDYEDPLEDLKWLIGTFYVEGIEGGTMKAANEALERVRADHAAPYRVTVSVRRSAR